MGTSPVELFLPYVRLLERVETQGEVEYNAVVRVGGHLHIVPSEPVVRAHVVELDEPRQLVRIRRTEPALGDAVAVSISPRAEAALLFGRSHGLSELRHISARLRSGRPVRVPLVPEEVRSGESWEIVVRLHVSWHGELSDLWFDVALRRGILLGCCYGLNVRPDSEYEIDLQSWFSLFFEGRPISDCTIGEARTGHFDPVGLTWLSFAGWTQSQREVALPDAVCYSWITSLLTDAKERGGHLMELVREDRHL